MKCPKCQFENPDGFKFCGSCAHQLKPQSDSVDKKNIETPGERKHVTIMFSDLARYIAMTERLDPEDVKEIMGLIFGQITKIVLSHEGFIEKFIGDSVMAVFGVPKTHENDPVRAIKTAKEIHAVIDTISTQIPEKISHHLAMRTGTKTGSVMSQ